MPAPPPSYLQNLNSETRDLLEQIQERLKKRTLSIKDEHEVRKCYLLLCDDEGATNGLVHSFMRFFGEQWFRNTIGKTNNEALLMLIARNDFEKAAFIIFCTTTDLKEQSHHIDAEYFAQTFHGVGDNLIDCSQQLETQKTPKLIAAFDRLVRSYRSLICRVSTIDRWAEGIDEERFLAVLNTVGRSQVKTDQTDAFWASVFQEFQEYPSVLMRISPNILNQRAEEIAQPFIASGNLSALHDFMTYYRIIKGERSLRSGLIGLLPAIGTKCEELSNEPAVRLFIQEVVQLDSNLLTAFNEKRKQPLRPIRHYKQTPSTEP